MALITGAGRGLGRAYALGLAARGCQVVVNDLGVSLDSSQRSEQAASHVVDEIVAHGGKAVASSHDVVTQSDEVVALAISKFGRIDVVINNAGALTGTTFSETSATVWQSLFDVHFAGTVRICRAAWPHLMEAGHGRIVNTASSALLGNSWMTSYGAAKGGIVGFSHSLAIEGESAGINVNCIFPTGWTRMSESLRDPQIAAALKHKFQPERVAAFVMWLAHAQTTVSKQMFIVGGGQVSRLEFAFAPFVKASEDTPEAWAGLQSQLLQPGLLTPARSTYDMLVKELESAIPNLRIDGEKADLEKRET